MDLHKKYAFFLINFLGLPWKIDLQDHTTFTMYVQNADFG